jgi:ComF family protein
MEIKNLTRIIYEFFIPTLCINCGTKTNNFNTSLCNSCKNQIIEINDPICVKCGIPFVSKQGPSHICGKCFKNKFYFDHARSFGIYKTILRDLIIRFKYFNSYIIGKNLAKLLLQKNFTRFNFKNFDAIIPVPLHKERLKIRGFNQSIILGHKLSTHYKIPLFYDALKKIENTEELSTLDFKTRGNLNLEKTFFIQKNLFLGKNILLIDDVFTTGATANACAKVLKKTGKAKQVDIITLARTVLD